MRGAGLLGSKLTAQEASAEASHRKYGYVELLALEQGLVAYSVVVVLPQGLHAVTDVALFEVSLASPQMKHEGQATTLT